jgi:hypothetical protein
MEKALFLGNFEVVSSHLLWILLYCTGTAIAAVWLFLRQMKQQ